MASNHDLKLMAVGDIHIKRSDPFSIFGGTIDYLHEADVLLGNQEGPTTDRGTPVPGKLEAGSIWIRANPASIEAEAKAGFTAVTVANNHMMDYGAEGLEQTLQLLDEYGIGHCGGGPSLREAHAPALIHKNGTRIAMLGYTCVFLPYNFAAAENQPGLAVIRVNTAYQASQNIPYQPGSPAVTVTIPNSDDVRRVEADIQQSRSAADLVVVQFHWGVAGSPDPVGYMKELGRAAVDAGADLVVGNHPHVIQGFEVYKNVLICYSLNNFAFEFRPGGGPPPFPTGGDALILTSEISNKRFAQHRLAIATLGEDSTLRLADEERRAHIKQVLEELSAEFGTTFNFEDERLLIGGPAAGTPAPLRSPDVLSDLPRVSAAGWHVAADAAQANRAAP